MMTETSPWGQAYLTELDRASAHLPADRRAELLADVASHLDQEIGPHTDDATARAVLDRLGDPATLVAEAEADLTPRRASPSGAEIVALLLMGLGGIVMPLLAPAVGVMIMRSTPRWSRHNVNVAWMILGVGVLALLFGLWLLSVTTETTSGALTAGLLALGVVVLAGPAAAVYASSRPRR